MDFKGKSHLCSETNPKCNHYNYFGCYIKRYDFPCEINTIISLLRRPAKICFVKKLLLILQFNRWYIYEWTVDCLKESFWTQMKLFKIPKYKTNHIKFSFWKFPYKYLPSSWIWNICHWTLNKHQSINVLSYSAQCFYFFHVEFGNRCFSNILIFFFYTLTFMHGCCKHVISTINYFCFDCCRNQMTYIIVLRRIHKSWPQVITLSGDGGTSSLELLLGWRTLYSFLG